MRDVVEKLARWWADGETVGAGAPSSAPTVRPPRQPGASMLVGPDGEAVGSVSGGCVEGAVYELGAAGAARRAARAAALRRLRRRRVRRRPHLRRHPRHLRREGEPGDVPAARGDRRGDRRRSSRSPSPRSSRARRSASGPRLVVWPDRVEGSTGSPRLDDAVRDDVRGLLDVGRNATLHYGVDGQRRGEGLEVFVESFAPPPAHDRLRRHRLRRGRRARSARSSASGSRCATRGRSSPRASRFPGADEVVVEWPHRYLAAEAEAGRIDARTVLCVLTHDPKFDVPLLEVALRLPEVAYIGAMGSRRTHDDRRARLASAGSPRLSSPGCQPRSGWTWVRGRRRRRPSRSRRS